MRIVFMGTPDFAACSFKALIEANLRPVGVFTQPDKPKSRGMRPAVGPVKMIARHGNIAFFQPEKLRDGTALENLKALEPDLIVVVAYGKILPEEFLAVPPLGCINIHGSLLPKYRGAAPIQWAVINGDKVTGVTSMYLEREMDTGDIIYTDETEIGEHETSGQLYERLKEMGARLLVKTVRDIEAGIAPRTPQNHALATMAPPLSKDLSPIDWTKTPHEINKLVCGLDPWPAATAELAGTRFKLYGVEYTDNRTDKPCGAIVSADPKRGIEVACGKGETILITRLLAPGGKRMSAGDYLLGHPIAPG